MATITKLPSGKHCVRIRRQGHKLITKSFIQKTDAVKWARTVESELDRGIFIDRSEAESTTLAQALDRYKREVTHRKKGAARELNRIEAWRQTDLASRSLASLRSADFASYRDRRLTEGKATNTVRLELALVSHVFTIAQQEWNIPVLNPIQSIRKPKGSNARTRRFEGDEEQRLMTATATHPYLSRLIVLALETACRQGELVNLSWSEIDLTQSVIKKETAKNGEGRVIPLTEKAKVALGQRGIGRLFPKSFPKKAWAAALKRAGIEDFHFHDLRHEAISRLSELGLNPLEVSAISGHKTLTMLKRYSHLRPADLLKKMNQA